MAHSRAAEPVQIPGLDLARAKRYSRIRLLTLLAATGWRIGRLVWFASDRRASRLATAIGAAGGGRLAAPCFIAMWTGLTWFSSLPVAFAAGFLVERRFALTRQPITGWFGDQAKGLALSLAVEVPLVAAAHQIMRRRPHDWWLMLSAAAVPLVVVFTNLAPTLVMPLFNTFTPLRDTVLRDRMHALAATAGVRISDVYEMDMSRQTEKPNAMFAGLAGSKRIVLGDTLLNRFEPDEIEAVVAHELGHQVHGDIWRSIGFGAGAGFGMAWLLSRLAPAVLRRTAGKTGVSNIDDVASLPILALVMTLLAFVLMPAQAAFSRAIERRADRFAVSLTGNGEAYARAMERLAAHALADPDPPRLVVLLLYSHPPIAERIRTARAVQGR